VRPSHFGIKDLFTTVNALGGCVAIFLCIEGHPFAAGVAVMLGYLCGDVLDGWVARKLGSANAFGAEYDTIVDHVAQAIAPAAVVYTVYRDHGLGGDAQIGTGVGAALGACIIVVASIRHARNAVEPVEHPGVWVGFPRPAMGFLAIGYVNSTLAFHAPGGLWLGTVVIPAACLASLSRLPYPHHRRGHQRYVWMLVTGFFVTTFGTLLLAPRFMFDVQFVWIFGYMCTAWICLSQDERIAFRRAVRAAVGGSMP
jgi:CDP-diacylglycerol--serine O-phosphatidyltransferase